MRRRAWLLATLMAELWLTGCASPDATGDPSGRSASQETVRWPYWPTSMRIHPLTRLVTDADSGRTFIEARIEFFDRDTHTTKGCGQLRIDLYDLSGVTPRGPLATWEMDLSDPATNLERYDDVTRTYLFTLDTELEELPAGPELRAYFLSADGRPLKEDQLRLRTE